MQTPPILLSALELDTRVRIIAISGSDQRIQILRRMGLVEGSLITLLEKSHGNLLVQSADSRIIMSNRLAESIHVELI
jgi:Fe2+ transport system protein FeoA